VPTGAYGILLIDNILSILLRFFPQFRKDESDGCVGLGRLELALSGKEHTPIVRNGELTPW
jgi:hypothetical protein